MLKRKIKNKRQDPKHLQEVSADENGRLVRALSKLAIIVGLLGSTESNTTPSAGDNPIEKPNLSRSEFLAKRKTNQLRQFKKD